MFIPSYFTAVLYSPLRRASLGVGINLIQNYNDLPTFPNYVQKIFRRGSLGVFRNNFCK